MNPLATLPFVAAGFAAGILYFHLLRWNTRLFVSRDLARALAAQISRLAGMTIVLVAAALNGAMPLLAVAGGVLLARPLILWREGRPP